MKTVEEIQEAIKSLPKDEYRQLMLWFAEHDWEVWDREIEEDAAGGKLEHLAGRAEEANRRSTLRNL